MSTRSERNNKVLKFWVKVFKKTSIHDPTIYNSYIVYRIVYREIAQPGLTLENSK